MRHYQFSNIRYPLSMTILTLAGLRLFVLCGYYYHGITKNTKIFNNCR
ncbi:MAG: hypothetical protein LBE12_01090 [Planctomycetaceae bacterium]|nr:hypothetical protein [Planctomycetaceae bacterium]